jgi:hypothetical protein
MDRSFDEMHKSQKHINKGVDAARQFQRETDVDVTPLFFIVPLLSLWLLRMVF